MFQLGPFQLHEQIGAGGMGSVWRATHAQQGVDVAVKLITARHAQEADWQALFRHEVRAVARLAHRGIVTVFDYGEVDEAVDGPVDVQVGVPFLAMELASQGTLLDATVESWPRARRAILEVLDALAHAHARGVIHLDLKPGNILVSGELDPVLKLSDFGLARALDEVTGGEDEQRLAGTPRFMAPEQIRGSLRDQGPWTDLYALGCLAYWVLCGRAPYEGEREEVLRGHLEGASPALAPRFPIPAAVTGWIQTMLSKDPAGRFEVCADAAHALEKIGETSDDMIEPAAAPPRSTGEAPTVVTDISSRPLVAADETTMGDVRPGPVAEPPGAWRRTEIPALSMKLIGTGLSLYGLRPVALVDREEERDLIWEQLRVVQRDRLPRAVVLRGGAGAGKSRLVEWVCERAAELGAARVLRVRHSPYGGPIDGLPRMIAEDLRCVGLRRDDALHRIRRSEDVAVRSLELYDTLALAGVAAGNARADMFRSQADWFDLVTRYLEARSRRRPVVLWVDDAQWGVEALQFTAHLLAREAEAPVLVLMTVRDDSLVDLPVAAAQLREVVSRTNSIERTLPPMSEEDQTRLVRNLLRLEPDLAAKVAARTAGNPLFAVQLVGDWVHRGILEVSDTGFRLVPGEKTPLPEDIFTVWSNRFERFLSHWPVADRERVRVGLEIAAALGLGVDDGEWRVALDHASVDAPPGIVETIVTRGLAVSRKGGWSFCHGMLRESIEAGARNAGRWAEHHAHCAAMVQSLYGADRLRHAERLTQHLLEAGNLETAKDTLLDAAEHACRLTDFEKADRCYEHRNEILDQLRVPEGSALRLRGLLEKARHGLRSGRARMQAVSGLLEDVESRSEGITDPDFLGLLNWVRSRLARHRGVPKEALEPAQAALSHYEEAGDPEAIAAVKKTLGENLRRLGRLEESIACYREAHRYYEEVGDLFQLGWCQYGMAVCYRQAGELDQAGRMLTAAAENFERSGGLLALGPVFNEQGELARWRGDLDTAEVLYWKGLHAMPPGYSDVGVVKLNLGYIALQRDEFVRAQELLDAGASDLLLAGRTGATLYAHAGRLVCIAGLQEWGSWDDCIAQVRDGLANGLLDRDVAQVIERSAAMCEDYGHPVRAIDAYRLAEAQWEALGQPDEHSRVKSRLAHLEGE